MRKLLIILSAVLMVYACKHEPSYIISGTVANPELEGKQVMITSSRWVTGETPRRDSTIITNGKYEFKGTLQEPDGYTITINPVDRENAIRIDIALENAKIMVSTDADGWSTVSGTTYNDRMQEFANAKRIPDKIWRKAYYTIRDARKAGTLTPELEKSLMEEQSKYRKESQDIINEYVIKEVNNPGMWGMTLNNAAISMSLEQQKELVARANETTLKRPEFTKINERIAGLERTAIGQPFSDLRMSDPEGKEIALSNYAGKGKYVLIDFWASWCGPCRQEMPNVVAAYKKYKNKGLEIVGVSFDSKHESWLKGIKDLGMDWPQMSDIKGWDSEGAKAYAVTGIPHTVLLDKDGTIIAKNVRGEELDKKLAELMK